MTHRHPRLVFPSRALPAALLLVLGCGSDGDPGPTAVDEERLLDPKACAECHPSHYDEWSGSMHAYAAEDPLFRAMNARGQREAGIGDFCVKCHAPLALRLGKTTDGLNLAEVPQALRGVTCYFCHNTDGVEASHSNSLHLARDGVMRGAIADPLENSFHGAAYSPLHDRDKLESSALCGSCHDVVNGHGVALERTFAEWQASVFNQAPAGATCGQCHMDQSRELGLAAQVPSAPLRRLHSHSFPGVDLALTPFPGREQQRALVTQLLDTTLQSALCVRGIASAARIEVILDNVAAGHAFPSGSAQDRRLWVELVAEAAGEVIYSSGKVPVGTPVATSTDTDLWLIRDCLADESGRKTHMFWEATEYASNLLPAQATFDRSDPAFYKSHVFAAYPGDGGVLPMPDRVELNVFLEPFGLEIFDELVATGDLTDVDGASLEAMRGGLAARRIGATLVWTPDTADESAVQGGIPVSCRSDTNLSGLASKVPADRLTGCAR